MTGLLVSVRDAEEAQAALAGGADLIDIKEPNAGSLGPASVETWQDILRVVDGRRPVSVALGELNTDPICEAGRQAEGMTFAKIGLAGCRSQESWSDRWRIAIDCLAMGVAKVAVIYVDSKAADSPEPDEILRLAISFGCHAVLFDTFSKLQGNLFDHLHATEITRLSIAARSSGLKIVLAGSLSGRSVDQAMRLAPDFIAVRGAVCAGDRRAKICIERVKQLAEVVHAKSTASV